MCRAACLRHACPLLMHVYCVQAWKPDGFDTIFIKSKESGRCVSARIRTHFPVHGKIIALLFKTRACAASYCSVDIDASKDVLTLELSTVCAGHTLLCFRGSRGLFLMQDYWPVQKSTSRLHSQSLRGSTLSQIACMRSIRSTSMNLSRSSNAERQPCSCSFVKVHADAGICKFEHQIQEI